MFSENADQVCHLKWIHVPLSPENIRVKWYNLGVFELKISEIWIKLGS